MKLALHNAVYTRWTTPRMRDHNAGIRESREPVSRKAAMKSATTVPLK